MASKQDNDRSYLKFAQIWNCYQSDYPAQDVIKKVLQKAGDINYKVPFNSRVCSQEPNLAGGTALHVAAIKNDVEIFEILLGEGADITIQNQHGRTALHCLVDQSAVNKELLDIVFSTRLLSLGDPSNPCDVDGISHFHIACMKDHVNAVEFLLNGGIPIDAAVNANSKKFAGYTGLHFAAENCALATIKVLLKRNASMHVRDARGLAPFHLLLEQKINMMDQINAGDQQLPNTPTVPEIDGALNVLLDSNDVDELGLTHFHVACAMQDSSVAEYYLNVERVYVDQQVPMDSPFRPGYTALHFAAHCNVKTAKMLLRKNAYFEVRDANGLTPMDLFWRLGKRKDLEAIFAQNWADVTFSDKKTRLLDFVDWVWCEMTLREYLDQVSHLTMTVNEGPTCWAGRTPLHFAVLLSISYHTLQIFMEFGFMWYVDAQDKFGSTPIHLAFRANKLDFAELLIKKTQVSENLVDKDGLSYLHIACVLEDETLVERFSLDTKNLGVVYRAAYPLGSIKPGSTALHVAVASGNYLIIGILLKRGLYLGTKDDDGQTPLHGFLRLKKNTERVCEALLSTASFTDHMLEKVGLTQLHVAIYCGHSNVLRYVEAEIINVSIRCNDSSSFFHRYDGCTPLHMAIERRASVEVVRALLAQGADLLALNRRGECPLYAALSGNADKNVMRLIVGKLLRNANQRKRLEEMSGITVLHLACRVVDVDAIASLLKENMDVEARVKSDCPVSAGFTPLHVLMKAIEFRGVSKKLCHVLLLLLEKNVDVSAENEEGETPIHLALQNSSAKHIYKVLYLLVDNLRVFNVNPIDRNGMSHFHAACLVNNVAAVKLFLENGVDVNQPIDFFAANFAGETPLHLALERKVEAIFSFKSQVETIDWLLDHGSDVRAEDSHGQTPLHKAVKINKQLNILEKIVRLGARVDSRNIFEQTPLELLCRSEHVTFDAIKFFENAGCRLNGSNPLTEEGYLSIVITHVPARTRCFNAMVKAFDWYLPDDMGRNSIHNMVTTNIPNSEFFHFHDLLQRFQSINIDIDLQDKKGKTALHLAAQFGNIVAVRELLAAGADVNVVDATNRLPLAYAMQNYHDKNYCPKHECHMEVIIHLASHVHTLELLGLEVSNMNHWLKEEAMKIIPYSEHDRLTSSRDIRVVHSVMSVSVGGSALCLGDFLSDTGKGFVSYTFMSDERREQVDTFFRSLHDSNQRFSNAKAVCMLQYRKAVKRIELVELAANSASTIANTNVPTDCIKVLFQYLTNGELENFIKATAA